MSEAAIVLWVIGFVVITLNVGIICETAEKIATIKHGKEDPEEQLERIVKANEAGVILHND